MSSSNNLKGKKSRSRGLIKIMTGLLGPSHHLLELGGKKKYLKFIGQAQTMVSNCDQVMMQP